MYSGEILNWKELVDQAGIDVAKDLSKKLREAVNKNPNTINHAFHWSDKHESEYLFQLSHKQKVPFGSKLWFNFTGTAS